MKRPLAAGGLLAVAMGLGGCQRAVPDPRTAVHLYAEAAARGDAKALYGLMTRAAQRERSLEDVARVVVSERAELADQARELSGEDTRVEATARFRYADGEEATLDLRHGAYGVTAAGALPGGGRSPEDALDQLRRVLARRSYSGLMRLLSPDTRAAIETDMRSLVEGLQEPDALNVRRTGDAAVVPIPGGHQVKLKRQEGIWRVEDFD